MRWTGGYMRKPMKIMTLGLCVLGLGIGNAWAQGRANGHTHAPAAAAATHGPAHGSPPVTPHVNPVANHGHSGAVTSTPSVAAPPKRATRAVAPDARFTFPPRATARIAPLLPGG